MIDDAPKDLQFDKAVPAGTSAEPPACAACRAPLRDAYFTLNGALICPACRSKAEAFVAEGSGVARFAKAAGAGAGAALVGSAAWFAITAATGYELGLVAIVLGLFVGGAVRWGSERRGGWVYQALAVFLTYTSIVSSYVPLILMESRKSEATAAPTLESVGPAAPADESVAAPVTPPQARPNLIGALFGLVLLVLLAYALPFLAGFQNVIGILIIGFALYEAWKMNRKTEIRFEGPFRVAAQ